MASLRARIRRALARHLYLYLAGLVAVAGAATVVLARDELSRSLAEFSWVWALPILGLSLVNYAIRFWKWQMLLGAVGLRIPVASSARIFFACFSMVVTPMRLGELYKVVFLRRLHGASLRRTAPVLAVERITDVIAIAALALWWFDRDLGLPALSLAVLLGAIVLGVLLGHERPRALAVAILRRLPGLRRRAEGLAEALSHNAALLRPSVLGPSLAVSVLAWGAEGVGLALILRALSSPIGIADAEWIYATATALGNLTFLPGGLGGTEASLVVLLEGVGVADDDARAATFLVRVATLWLAVLLGLVVSWLGRRALQWNEIRASGEGLD